MHAIRFHGLRPWTVPLLQEQGAGLVGAKELLGHDHINVYTHRLDLQYLEHRRP
ncbi:hypothetical protein ACOALZ_17640 [Nocardiopsis algeriensis]|uniref:hypothetical protein n=1 Tax=Nocardiopsis algeriensis TaxID=1478215 RepID=UPI003B43CB43